MKILIILAHPRDTSLTYQVKASFEKGLEESDHQVDTLDLYKTKFNPVLFEEDEPEWSAETQKFSDEVYQEMDRLMKYDSVVFAFPLYWSSMPAIMKGYVDRIWNYTLAYGPGSKLKIEKVLFLILVGVVEKNSETQISQKSISANLHNMISFCGQVPKIKTKMFFGTITRNPDTGKKHISDAYEEGLSFEKW